jgi:CRISPR-associated protein Csb2
MLIVELSFPAGRYHATPWGRNVNEGEAEWPPSPYRLARGLVDVWKRRRPDWDETRVSRLLEVLSSPPKFHLPPGTSAHTRSYLSSNDKDPGKKQLIFDAFVVVNPTATVVMGFEADLDATSLLDLDELLQAMNYLGRSESWVKAKVAKDRWDVNWNCFPLSGGTTPPEHESTVEVACIRTPSAYSELAFRPEKIELRGKKLVKTGTACSWIEALCLDTKRLLNEGWSEAPALEWVRYHRDAGTAMSRTPLTGYAREVRYARYALVSNVLPRLTETVSFAEKIRRHLMGIHRRIQDKDATKVSWRFSGKGQDGGPLQGHGHAFYLPVDEDGDGRLDHLWVISRDPFEASEVKALDRLRSVWQSNGRPDVSLVLTSLGEVSNPLESRQWVSVSPFVTARHYRKGRGTYPEWLSSEIQRECHFHGLPVPESIEWVPRTVHTSHAFHWWEFLRSRQGQQPLRGDGCILTFGQKIRGPFSLGSGCHYGLGLFMPRDAMNLPRTSSSQ